MPDITYHPVLVRITYSVPDRSTVRTFVAHRAAIVSGQIEFAERSAAIKLIPRFLMTYKGSTFTASHDDHVQMVTAHLRAKEYLEAKCRNSPNFRDRTISIIEVEIDLRNLHPTVT
jgi:hypothetical protein